MADSNYTQEAEFKRLAEQIPEDRQWAVMKKLIEAGFLPIHGLSAHRMEILTEFTAQLIRQQEAETVPA